MNNSLKMLLAGAAIITLSANAFARGGDCPYGGGPGGMMGMDQERMEKMHDQRLADLHDKLKLTAQQEPLWKRFAAQRPFMDRSTRLDPAEIEKLSAPQRLEKGLERLRTVEAKLSEHLGLLKELYTVLTPEQQKIFDAETPHFGPGPRGGR